MSRLMYDIKRPSFIQRTQIATNWSHVVAVPCLVPCGEGKKNNTIYLLGSTKISHFPSPAVPVCSGAVTIQHALAFLSPALAGRAARREGNERIHNQRGPSQERSSLPAPRGPWVVRRQTQSQYRWGGLGCLSSSLLNYSNIFGFFFSITHMVLTLFALQVTE